jgi:hypothetical protein
MPTLFPLVLDNFSNPASGTYLDGSNATPALRHHIQHTNINDAVTAIQTRIGVTGSTVSTTIDYELHNVVHGHNHDGINSRPVSLGFVCDDGSGLFEFTTATIAGEAICELNKVLKSLAPKPAPDLDNIGVVDLGVAGLLSFGSSQGIVGFTNVSGTGSLPSVNINGSYSSTSFSGDLRRGLFNNTTIINGILNDDVVADNPNYPADAFGDADQGFLYMELNGSTIVSASLSSTTLAITSSSPNGSFLAVSTLRTGSFPNGDSFDLWKHRTGVWSVAPLDQRNGWNVVKVIHDISGSRTITNYVEWVVDNNPTPPTAPSGSLHSINLTGLKYLTGVKYYTGGTVLYNTAISGAYRNAYSSGTAITFTNSSNVSFVGQALSGITVGVDNEFKVENIINKSGTITATKLLPGAITASVNCTKPIGGNLINGGVATIGQIFLNNQAPNSTQLRDQFRDEFYRLEASNYDLQADVPVSGWDGTLNRSGSTVQPLVVFDECLRGLPGLPNSGGGNGDFTGFANGPSGNVDYSDFSGSLYYYRQFINNTGGARSNFDLQLTGSGVWSTSSLDLGANNRFLVEVKLPEKTGWNIYTPFQKLGDPQIPNDNAGILNGAFTSTLPATNKGTFGTIFVDDGEYIVVRITANHAWTGRVCDMRLVWTS